MFRLVPRKYKVLKGINNILILKLIKTVWKAFLFIIQISLYIFLVELLLSQLLILNRLYLN